MIPLAEVRSLAAAGYNVIPLARRHIADQVTPVALFARLEPRARHAFLLESVSGGESVARYSFLGTDPFRTFRFRGARHEIDENGAVQCGEGYPLGVLAELLAGHRPYRPEGLPRFSGGAVGFFAYDAVRQMEHLPERSAAELPLDDGVFGFYDTVVAFDHARQTVTLVHNLRLDGPRQDAQDIAAAYAAGLERLDRLGGLLNAGGGGDMPPFPETAGEAGGGNIDAAGREAFMTAVERAKEYIAAGEIFQVVLSRRERIAISAAPLAIYRALRMVNPSPYMVFLKHDETCVIGASPEMLVRVVDGRAEIRPIAGTRRRGRDVVEDQALERELAADPKERAEHLMLVDLGRNDLGRVCRPGSIEVGKFMAVERYSHLMHLVSEVRGDLRPGVAPLEALAACFPAGTVSGAPKIRAMEIIEELEPMRRGIYAGAIPYIDFSGNLDSCISIRTLVLHAGIAYLQAGAGIVADSTPQREFEETEEKLRALRAALAVAERMGDA